MKICVTWRIGGEHGEKNSGAFYQDWMDRYIKDFLKRKPDSVIVQLGCGLETTFYRDDNGTTHWYGVDLPNVIQYRKSIMPESEREKYIAGDAFDSAWLKQVRDEAPNAPILITSSGLFMRFVLRA